MVESLDFGQYMTGELFRDVDMGRYVPSAKDVAVYAISGTMALSSGCSKEKRSGLHEGDILTGYTAELAGDGKNYVLLDFPNPPGAGKKYRGAADIVLASKDSAEAVRLRDCLRGKAVIIKHIEKGRFYKTASGDVRYNAAPGDIMLYDGKDMYDFPCGKEEKVPEKNPVQSPHKGGGGKSAASSGTKKEAQQTVVVNFTMELPQEKPQKDGGTTIVNNFYGQPQEPVVIVERVPVPMHGMPGRGYPVWGYGGWNPHMEIIHTYRSRNQRTTFVPSRGRVCF